MQNEQEIPLTEDEKETLKKIVEAVNKEEQLTVNQIHQSYEQIKYNRLSGALSILLSHRGLDHDSYTLSPDLTKLVKRT
jgi:hypothetical protein